MCDTLSSLKHVIIIEDGSVLAQSTRAPAQGCCGGLRMEPDNAPDWSRMNDKERQARRNSV